VKTIEEKFSPDTENNLVSVIGSDILFINDYERDKARYTYFNVDQTTGQYIDNKGYISEQTLFKFAYPNLIMVKGCLEVIYYSFLNNIFYYEKLNCPIVMGITNAVDNA